MTNNDIDTGSMEYEYVIKRNGSTEKVYFDEYFASVDKSLEGIFPDHEVRIRDWSDDLTRFLFISPNFFPDVVSPKTP